LVRMSYVSQVLGGGEPIGSDRFFAESGTSITEEGGAFWLRSGLAATAASYPRAAQLEHCKISGIAATNATSMTILQVADNGAGVIVATYSGAGSGLVLASTDSGANYAVVNTGMSAIPTGVVFNGTRFIIVGNSSSDIYTRFSTDGTTWSAGANQLHGGNNQTAKIAWNGSIAYGLVDGSTGPWSAFTTTDGATLTSRSAPAALSCKTLIAGGGTFFISQSGTQAYTTATGASYTSVTLPTSGDMAAYLGGTWMIKGDQSSVYFTSTNLTAFTQRRMPGQNSNLVNYRALSFDSNRVYAGMYSQPTNLGAPCILWTDDLISWKMRGLTDSLVSLTTWYCHAGKYFFPKGDNASKKILHTASFAAADFVGAVIESSSSIPHSVSGTPTLYRKLAD